MRKGLGRVLFAACVGIVVILAMAGMFAWLIRNETLDVCHMDLMAAGVLIAGSGAAAMCSGRGEGSLKRMASSELGVILFLGLLNLLLFDGQISGLIPCVILIFGTAGAVFLALLGTGLKTGRKYRHKRRQMGMLNKKYRR